MEGPNLEHSDSDSGESWTLLDQKPSYAADPLESYNGIQETFNHDKDDDTDGISIISDSDHEHISTNDNTRSVNQSPSIDDSGSRHEEPFVSINEAIVDSNGKIKTYVHRRNKKLSTVLNIIMLGSVITAAGVAIGHTWGLRNDCSIQNSVSVNKILSSLYKLEEQNAFLRSKVRELALLNQQRNPYNAPTSVKIKKNRCRKVFEETLNNRKAQKFLKCVDNSTPDLNSQIKPVFEQEFLNDVNVLKRVYQQNRSWLDEEIRSRLKQEIKFSKQNNTKDSKTVSGNQSEGKKTKHKIDSSEQGKTTTSSLITPGSEKDWHKIQDVKYQIEPQNDEIKLMHYSVNFAQNNNFNKASKANLIDINNELNKKRNTKGKYTTSVETSETEIKKDDRYIKNKHKNYKKKHDRQKSFKKLKRRNKYEQWEMKGGYLRDYDDISIPSLMESEYNVKTTDKKNAAQDNENNNLVIQFSKVANSQRKYEDKDLTTENNAQEINWYEKRTQSRKQARKMLEKQLFGESSPNTSAWYFRRMHRREQCRVKDDNSTYKKKLKRYMNYKMKL